jgi:hypothetical protein
LVWLTPEQRDAITRNGHASAKKIRHAQVLLWSDGHREVGRLSSREIAERLSMHDNSMDRIRKRFALEGEELAKEVAAWKDARNADGSTVRWRFTTADARIRLRHCYPQV